MLRDIQQYPHRAKEYGYSYPDNPYLTESIAYAELNVSIFCKPKFISTRNPTGLTVELVEGQFTDSQKRTIDTFLKQQDAIKLASPIIAFYNRCLEVIADSYNQEDLIEFGATPLADNDVASLEKRIYLEDVHLTSLDAYGDFGLEFEWNLDPEHTITARFKTWTLAEVNFTSDIIW